MGWRPRTDSRGVVPDLAEVFLVAIAVVLTAIVATTVFGFVETFLTVGPTAALGFDFVPNGGAGADCGDPTGDRLAVVHEAGNNLIAESVWVRGSSVPNATVSLDDDCTGLGSTMTAGESVSVAVESDDTVHVVWREGNQSARIGVWEGPDA